MINVFMKQTVPTILTNKFKFQKKTILLHEYKLQKLTLYRTLQCLILPILLVLLSPLPWWQFMHSVYHKLSA